MIEKKKLNNTSLANQAYKLIKEMILRNEILPGEKVSIYYLADKLGVSQTPIREAMSKLKLDGIVKQGSNKRFKVSEITIEDIHNIYEVRELFEPQVVKHSCKLINERKELCEKIQSLKKRTKDILNILKNQKQLGDEKYQSYLEVDEKLDEVISQSLSNSLLEKMFSLMGDKSLRVRCYAEALTEPHRENVIENATQEHLEIINLILHKNKDKAAEATERHLENAHRRTIEALEGCQDL